MKLKVCVALLFLITLNSCFSSKSISDQPKTENTVAEISSITNKAPYDPRPGMTELRKENVRKRSNGKVKLKKPMHFLVFGDSKGSDRLPDVLKRADVLTPQFCLTTADLVNKGAGELGEELYKDLDTDAGWFFRKYPTWPTLGNHEVSGPKENSGTENYASGVKNFGDFFGLKDPLYSFSYGNAHFIALDWIKASESPERLIWLEKELKSAQGKHIFVFKHRPYYTVGNKSYNDVEGKSTVITKLFTKYKVTAVFSGHDHLYYRTLRDGVNYIVSAGAGASIYQLKRQGDAIEGDSYYGRKVGDKDEYLFHPAKGKEVSFNEAMYFVLSVKVNKEKVTFKMIDTEGKTWDKFTFKSGL
ncbi:MAG: metallophosphoesterase [Maribacter sp.]|nr:metallophosphoesterase [Maribacter sp.]